MLKNKALVKLFSKTISLSHIISSILILDIKMNLVAKNLNKLQSAIRQNFPNQPKIIAVSKNISSDKIRQLYEFGQRDFGENYVQEFNQKACHLSDLEIVWHFIGKIQTNKTKYIAEKASWAHSLENEKQIIRLNSQRPQNLSPLNVLIAVNISEEKSKAGIKTFEEILQLAKTINLQPKLKLRGLMGIASNTNDITIIKQQFINLKVFFDRLKTIYPSLIDSLSMGMSNDYNIALEVGANIIRIGTLIFGDRNYV